MPLDVTVVIPAYLRAQSLGKAIESGIKHAQVPAEIIVVDDCSTDKTGEVCKGFGDKIRYLRHSENRGAAAARNTGVRAASSEWIAFLDADDHWLVNKLGKQMRFMTERGFRVSCTDFTLVHRSGAERGHSLVKDELLELRHFLWGCFICPGSTMIVRKAVFEQFGYFDESLRRLEDWDWFLRIARHEQVGNLREVLSVINDTGFPHESAVVSSLEIIRSKYMGTGGFSNREKRCIRAGMAMEAAKMAWVREDYLLLVLYLIKSLCHAPLGNRAFNTVVARKLRYGF
jgi:glycosyltransferase involved in cell wall biosynthesis